MGKELLLVTLAIHILSGAVCIYQPTWESLDSRPLPSWYDEAKLGIFIHWGVFSVPSYSSEWFWWNWKGLPTPAIVEFMAENYKSDFTYADFAKEFTAEFFEASQWAEILKSSGAKYVVFVSKHHEGFSNYNSKYSFNWNSVAVGPNRDIVDELAQAIRSNTDLKFGLYHSRFEWFNPLYLADKKSGFKTQDFVNHKTLAELYELVKAYKPEIVWSDGDWEAPDTYWKSKEFLTWLYNESPVNATVVTNDRWGQGCTCKHGGFYTCSDRYNPGVLQKHKFENAMTIDKYSWGYRRNAHLSDYLTMEELLQTFVTTVSCGGNMLMNVGPPKHGHIAPIYEERLREMGAWLKVNGEGIYSSKPWSYQNDTMTKGVWYTTKKTPIGKDIYAFIFEWPATQVLSLACPSVSSSTQVILLGFPGAVTFKSKGPAGIDIQVPYISPANMPCNYLWTFKITNILN